MTTFNTGNPVGSTAVKDLYDNAENLDAAINGPGLSWTDRLGVVRESWAGFKVAFDTFIADGSTIEFPTWAAASAAAAASQIPPNRQVAVIGDTGTHVDPVSGLEVSNSGRYVMVAAGLQWRGADVLSQKLDADLANPRIVEFPRRSAFVAGQVFGPFYNDLDTITPTNAFVDGSGALVVDNPPGTTLPRMYATGQRRFADDDVEVICEVTPSEIIEGNLGPFVGFGDSAVEFRGVYFSSGGALAIVDNAGTTVGASLSAAEIAFAVGERAFLRVVVRGDGTGFAVARQPSTGVERKLLFTGIPSGSIWAVWRRSNKGAINTFQVRQQRPMGQRDIARPLNASGGMYVGGFAIDDVDGFYRSDTGVLSTRNWGVDAQGRLNVTNNLTGIILADMGFRRLARGAYEFEIATETISAGSTASGAIISVGDDPATRVAFAYLINGFVGVLSASNTTLLGGAVAGMACEVGDIAKLRVSIREDGSATVEAVAPSGRTHRLRYAGTPMGTVWAACRGNGSYRIHRMDMVTAAPVAAGIEPRLAVLEAGSLTPDEIIALPDATPDRQPTGWTCTGACEIPRGSMAGMHAVGDDGRLVETSPGPFAPKVHIVDSAARRILRTLDLGYSSSVQGVAAGIEAPEPTLWVACSADGTIRNYELTGDEVVANRITWADLGITDTNPNALAFDPLGGTGKGALWACGSVSRTAYLIDADPEAETRILRSVMLTNIPDHFQLIDDKLLYQTGNNGQEANIRCYNLTYEADTLQWGPLKRAMAAEGFVYSAATRTLRQYNDPGFHVIGTSPAINCQLVYRGLPPP